MKPFDQALYDADDNAKHLIVEWFNRHGWTMQVNPDEYGIDLIGFDALLRPATIEVEVKHHWTTPTFPFKTVHVSARKRKFIDPGSYLVMLNHDRTHALTYSFADFTVAKLIRKDTIYTTDEMFFELPVGMPRRIR